jgi:hypothetical protein
MIKKTSHPAQISSLEEYVPSVFAQQDVPSIDQHDRPALVPPFTPSNPVDVAAGHTPNLEAFLPSGSLPHFFMSQQLSFFMISLVMTI